MFTLVGLLLGVFVAVLASLASDGKDFAVTSYVFGSIALCALVAFWKPVLAMDAVPALAHFVAGLFTGLVFPEVIPEVSNRATKTELFLFWLGVVAVLLVWLAYTLQ